MSHKETKKLEITAELSDALFLAQIMGSAEGVGGTKYDVLAHLGGAAIVVRVTEQNTEKRRQYVITCEELVNAVARAERQAKAKKSKKAAKAKPAA